MNLPDIGEAALRLTAFAAVFVVMAVLEVLIPQRELAQPKPRRWMTNLSIVALGSVLVRGLVWLSSVLGLPLAAVLAAEVAGRNGWGLLSAWSEGPAWAKTVIAVVVLDFAIYLQHVISHKVGVFWRLHQMHHADPDIDVSTALRFHPVEIGLSMLYKVAWVLALGPSVAAVVIFEVVLNACAMFNHANVRLPVPLDRVLRWALVTPDMHRVHHSVIRDEHDSNYGFNLSIWDRLFGTYTTEPRAGQLGMTIGLAPYQSPAPAGLGRSLALPFKAGRGGSQ